MVRAELAGQRRRVELPAHGERVRLRAPAARKHHRGGRLEKYDLFVQGLPTATFLRKKARIEISFLSKLGGSELVEEFCPPTLPPFLSS
jgi:hypothetical protein